MAAVSGAFWAQPANAANPAARNAACLILNIPHPLGFKVAHGSISHARCARSRPTDRSGRNPRGARAHRRHDRAYAARAARTRGGASGHPAQAREPAADQRLQAARRRQRGGDALERRASARRVDHQRRQRRPGRRLRGAPGRSPLHGGRDRDRARLQARADARAWRQAGAGALRRRLEGDGATRLPGRRGHLHPSLRRSQLHRRPRHHGSRDPGGRARNRRGHRRHWRRRAGHRASPARLKALKPEIKVWGAEPETAAPAARSFASGTAQPFPEWEASFVDGAGGKSMFPRMWERMQPLVDGSIVVTLEQTGRRCG